MHGRTDPDPNRGPIRGGDQREEYEWVPGETYRCSTESNDAPAQWNQRCPDNEKDEGVNPSLGFLVVSLHSHGCILAYGMATHQYVRNFLDTCRPRRFPAFLEPVVFAHRVAPFPRGRAVDLRASRITAPDAAREATAEVWGSPSRYVGRLSICEIENAYMRDVRFGA